MIELIQYSHRKLLTTILIFEICLPILITGGRTAKPDAFQMRSMINWNTNIFSCTVPIVLLFLFNL